MQKKDRGSTLLEVLMMVSVAALLVTGLVASTINSVGNARASRMRSQAVRFAQEGMELVRGERDKSWKPFSNKNGNYCLGENGNLTSQPNCTPNVGDNVFTRTALFEWVASPGYMKVTITVAWPEGSGQKNTTLISFFTDWK